MARFGGLIRGSKGEARRLGDEFSGLILQGTGHSLGVRVELVIDPQTHEETAKIELIEGFNQPKKGRLIGCFKVKDLK